MNPTINATKRILTGVIAGLCVLVGAEAQAASKQVEVTTILPSGAERVSCVIISPADNRSAVYPGACSFEDAPSVIISPADNRILFPSLPVIISPADNRSEADPSVIISPADNRGTCNGETVIISPADNLVKVDVVSQFVENGPSVIISPADNRFCFDGVIISPADNRSGNITVVTDESGMSAVIAGTSSRSVSLSQSSTLQAEAVLALVDAGVAPRQISMDSVGAAVKGLSFSEASLSRVADAAFDAADFKAAGTCASTDSLVSALCKAVR